MSSSETPLYIIYNYLGSFCRDLDYLADPSIEEGMVCTLDCCIGNNTPRYFEALLGNDLPLYESVLGSHGIEMVRQFQKELDEAIYYDDEQGFSKKPRWKQFSALAERLSLHIKDSVKKHESMEKKQIFE